MTTFLNDLEAKARAANSDKWEESNGTGYLKSIFAFTERGARLEIAARLERDDAAFIVAVQPSVTLKLIEALRKAEEALREIRGQLIYVGGTVFKCGSLAREAQDKINDLLK